MKAARFEPLLFGFVLSGCMSLVVSAIATWRALGSAADTRAWIAAWLPAWAIAYPVVLLVAPIARRAVQRLLAWGVRRGWLVADR